MMELESLEGVSRRNWARAESFFSIIWQVRKY